MTNPNVKNFNPGGIKDRYDSRDYQWSEVGHGAAPFDWTAGFDIESVLGLKLTIKDQDGSGSCGGQAWAYLAEVLESLNTKTYEPRSAKFIYAQTYVPGGGSYGRDNADVFVKQGVSEETKLTSYENGLPPSEAFMQRSQDITDDVRSNAKLDQSSSYVQTGTDIDTVAQAIVNTGGVILGVCGSNNSTWGTVYPVPPKPTDTIWRHWLYAGKAKLENGKKYIGVINSWGQGIGDKGIQWLSEDYFASPGAIFSGWTHVYSGNLPPVVPFKHYFPTTMDYGMTSVEVNWLQKALTLEGCFPVSIVPTSFFGNVTRQAVQKFQVKYNIVLSGTALTTGYGRVGTKTLAKLNSIYA